MRPKRLISLLVAVCMMITMLPLSAVTAFAADIPALGEDEFDYQGLRYKETEQFHCLRCGGLWKYRRRE